MQPHDDEPNSENRKENYFVPPCFYCVETICAPCGAVHAWTLFEVAESPTNILNFLDAIFPTSDVRPDYTCIDKGCQVTSGYPWSSPIRLDNFSYELSLIGIFLDGLPGTIVLPQDNLYFPPDHSWDGPFGGSQDG